MMNKENKSSKQLQIDKTLLKSLVSFLPYLSSQREEPQMEQAVLYLRRAPSLLKRESNPTY